MPVQAKPYLTADNPMVIDCLSPVYRSSQTIFFVIEDDGMHSRINVGERLHSIGISWTNVAKVIQSYPFKQLTYRSESKTAIAAGKGKPRGNGPKPKIEEEEVLESAKKGKHQRYSLVQRGSYFGCYDSRDATVVLFAEERDAKRHIYELLHHRGGLQCLLW
jgi:hypothetical protein